LKQDVHDATRTAYASFEQKWLDANPQNAFVGVFLPAARRAREWAFGTLVHELEQAAFQVREPEVAAAKLHWWQEELSAAAAGNARHPVTKILFTDPKVRAVDVLVWPALAGGAASIVEPASCATLQALLDSFTAFHGAVARAEAALFSGGGPATASNAALWTISHLLRVLATAPEAAASLPLDLLARHGATRAVLDSATPLRTAVLHDYLVALAEALRDALAMAVPASLTQRVRSSLDLQRASAALDAVDPLAYLAAHVWPGRWRSLLTAWRQARLIAAQET
jgi:15-cis-phytoene synthase